ncbi:hypothetical protein ZIOFF_034460 [Zingiber officinale]|uniref:Fucosyltransferase n=1 Tax=Zingiber officinale TaxID=94328 RepID=A0A8J5GKY9_ZINOF|nr:hypothetical protein ZIOFF_034460 [Zingiber officinale]
MIYSVKLRCTIILNVLNVLFLIQDWRSCSIDCHFGFSNEKVPDASFGLPQNPAVAAVLRSMESSPFHFHRYKVVMTTSLSSDVPVGYCSYAEYEIMAPVLPKTEEALADAFVSNCGARNFRLQALEMQEELLNCFLCAYLDAVNKVETLKRYKFSLAFENSNEEDYVTEKLFQPPVAGVLFKLIYAILTIQLLLYFLTPHHEDLHFVPFLYSAATVPVVIGAPNIQEFAPCLDCILHIKEAKDVASVAKSSLPLRQQSRNSLPLVCQRTRSIQNGEHLHELHIHCRI